MKIKRIMTVCLSILMVASFSLIFSACKKEPELLKVDPKRIEIKNDEAIYDGQSHIFDVWYNGKRMDTVQFSTDDGRTFGVASALQLTGSPDADTSYRVYYKIRIEGFEDFVSYASMRIVLPAISGGVTVENDEHEYDGTHKMFTVKYNGAIPENLMFSENANGPYVSYLNFKGYKGSPVSQFEGTVYYKFKISGAKEYYGSAILKIGLKEIDISKISFPDLDGAGDKYFIDQNQYVHTEYDGSPQMFKIQYNEEDVTNISYSLEENGEYVSNLQLVNAGEEKIVYYKFKLPGFKEFKGSQIFKIYPKSLDVNNIAVDDQNCVYTGSRLTPSIVFGDRLVTTNDYTLNWVGGCVNAGSYKVKITGKNNFTGTIEKEFTIKQKPLKDSFVGSFNSEKTYTGSEINPDITMYDYDRSGENEKNLDLGLEYTIEYKQGVNSAELINAGSYYIYIVGVGNYTGEIRRSFTILPYYISLATDVKITNRDALVYTGNEVIPEVEIYRDVDNNGQGVLIPSEGFYSLVHKDNIDAGSATLTIQLTVSGNNIGNYKFDTNSYSASMSYQIKPRAFDVENGKDSITINDNVEDVRYSGSPFDFNIVVEGYHKGESATLIKGVDYNLEYYKGDPKVNEIKGAGTYQIKAVGIGNYAGSLTYSNLEINPKTIEYGQDKDLYCQATIFDYNGNKKTVSLDLSSIITIDDYTPKIVKCNETTTGEVEVGEIKEAGTYKVYVTGKRNFEGETSFEVTVNAKVISDPIWTIPELEFEYDGTEKKPALSITDKKVDGLTTFLAGTDYTVEYYNNINAGENSAYAKVVITDSNYKFASGKEVKLYFSIKGTNLTDDNSVITLLNEIVEYNGQAQTVDLTVVCGGETLTANENYTVVYKKNETTVDELKNAGTYTVEVVGTGKYYGTISKTFEIRKKSVTLTVENLIVEQGTPVEELNFDSHINGLVDGDMLHYVLSATNYTVESACGTTYNIELVEWDNQNYQIEYTEIATLTVADLVKVGEQFYSSLVEAFDAANDGDVITLYKDAVVSDVGESVPLYQAVTINGQGHTITFEACNVYVNASLTLKDLTIIMQSEDSFISSSDYEIELIDSIINGKVEFSGVEFGETFSTIGYTDIRFTNECIFPSSVESYGLIIEGETVSNVYLEECHFNESKGILVNSECVLTLVNNVFTDCDAEGCEEGFMMEYGDIVITFGDGITYDVDDLEYSEDNKLTITTSKSDEE